MRSRPGIALLIAMSALAGCSSAGSTPAVNTTSASSGKLQVKFTKLPPTKQLGQVDAVTAPGASQAWAIGETFGPSGEFALADRWNGSVWQQFKFQSSKLMRSVSEWDAVSSDSPGNVWIFGQTKYLLNVWVHIQHGHVHVGQGELPHSSFISSAVAVGADGVWAFRNPNGRTSPMYAWHYMGGRGVRFTLPGRAASVIGTAATAPNNIWAVASYDFGAVHKAGGVLFHYLRGHWQRIPLPPALYSVSNVVACGPNCAWVGGGIAHSGRTKEGVARWNGSSWRLISPPVPPTPRKHGTDHFQLVPDGHGGFWGSGVGIWRYSSGTWSKATSLTKAPLGDVMAWVQGTTSFWVEAFSRKDPTRSGPLLALITHGR